MATQLHYKDNKTFQINLAMGFVGESAAIALMRTHGHEFEFDGFGAGSVEIFKDVFLKQKRNPDLKCSRCGQMLEVRAKSALKISMSDSPSRQFDRELKLPVWVGFVRVVLREPNLDKLDPASYLASTDIYVIPVSELSAKKHKATRSRPKSKDKGSETYLTWPSLLSPVNGELLGIERDPSLVYIRGDDGNIRRVEPPPGSYLYNGIREGHRVLAKETIVCGVAKTLSSLALKCKGSREPG